MKTIMSTIIVGLATIMSIATHAAEPTNIDELKAHYEEVTTLPKSMLADFTMTMDMTTPDEEMPEALAMGDMSINGTLMSLNDAMRMDMTMSMGMGEQTMIMNMLIDDAGIMHVLIDMGGMFQATKMDMSVMQELAADLGVPEAALNSNMGMDLMLHPAKMLDMYEGMYTLELLGKETLDGEEVFVLKAQINPEVLEKMAENPLMAQQSSMFDDAQKLYLGAQDGIMRKMQMGEYMSMTLSNIDTKTEVTKEDLDIEIPAGVQVMDLTEMMTAMYAGDTETVDQITEEIVADQLENQAAE